MSDYTKTYYLYQINRTSEQQMTQFDPEQILMGKLIGFINPRERWVCVAKIIVKPKNQ